MEIISAENIAQLEGSLGTVEGLADVHHRIESLRAMLADPSRRPSRAELAQMLSALGSLSAAILSMDQVTRQLLGRGHQGAIDCVG